MSSDRAPLLRERLASGSPEWNAVQDFSGWLAQRFGSRLKELRLFGSRARGEADEDSDLDLLVVIDSLSGAERREIAQQSGDAISDWGVPLSPFPMSTEHFAELRARERLIVSEIERDGIPL